MLLLFSAVFFQNKPFRYILTSSIEVPNGLDPDQDRHSVGPVLGPNCLQRLSADDKVIASKERVNHVYNEEPI